MTYIPKFQDALVALPSVIALDALLSGGVESLPEDIYEALRRDDMSRALEAGEDWHENGAASPDERAVAYALLMEGCDLLDEALEFVQESRQTYPEQPSLTLVEAELRLERGEIDRAEELLVGFVDEHLDGQEIDGPVWGFAADLLLDAGQDDRALEAYEKAVAMGTEDFETVIRLAQMHTEREDWKRAAECFELAADFGGDVVGPWREAAECWRKAGQMQRSLQARQEVLDREGGEAETWARQGVGFAKVGEMEEAIAALKKATRLEPNRPEYWIELAHLLRRTGQSEEAIAGYKRVLETEDAFVEALNGLTAAALDQGDVALAAENAREAVEIAGDNADAWYLLGRSLKASHQFQGARDAMRRAIALDAEVAEYHEQLGELLLEAGQADEGYAEMERAVELSADDGTVIIPFAEALLGAKEYGRLRELLEQPKRWKLSARWHLIKPLFALVLEGIEKTDAAMEEAIDAFETAVERHPDEIPVEEDLDELARYALVLDERRQWAVETMIDILEGRKQMNELKPQTD